MALRPQAIERVQLGVEGSYGSIAAANKILPSLMIAIDDFGIPTEEDQSSGFMAPSGVVVAKEMSKMSAKGKASFNDLLYALSSQLCSPSITTPMGATLTRLWTFAPISDDVNDCESYTLEVGSSIGAARVQGVRFTDSELTFTPEKSIDYTGAMIGKSVDDAASMTGGPTVVAKKTMSSRGIDFFVADSVSGLGAGQIRPLQSNWGSKGRHTGVQTLASDETSLDATVENPFGLTGQLVVPAGTDAAGYLTNLRAADKKFAMWRVTGPDIDGGFPYMMEITMPFAFRNPKPGTTQAVHTRTFDLVGLHDEDDLGGAVLVKVWTALTAL